VTLAEAHLPILVTGSHRSGTSWVGEMIGSAEFPNVGYIYEPFNPRHRPGVFAPPTPYTFFYICRDNEHDYLPSVEATLGFRYGTARELRSIRSIRDVGRMGRHWIRFRRHRRQGALPVVKDPFALFSAEWFAERFGARVVVMIRHPAGFVSSLKFRDQSHPFADFLGQPLLMRDHLAPFEPEIRAFSVVERSPIEQGILLWKLLYSTVARYRESHPDWTFLRLEDAASDPVGEFTQVFARLGLRFDESIRRTIQDYTASTNPAETPDPSVIKRDSRRAILTWKDRLTPEEVDQIHEGVRPVADHFYSKAEWAG
jgi:hypothetical protein